DAFTHPKRVNATRTETQELWELTLSGDGDGAGTWPAAARTVPEVRSSGGGRREPFGDHGYRRRALQRAEGAPWRAGLQDRDGNVCSCGHAAPHLAHRRRRYRWSHKYSVFSKYSSTSRSVDVVNCGVT